MTLVTLMIFSSINAQVLNDTVVYDYLKSVQISPEGEPLDFPAYELGARKGLELSFDDLAYEWNNYSYRIFHCTKNWEKSDLFIIIFLSILQVLLHLTIMILTGVQPTINQR